MMTIDQLITHLQRMSQAGLGARRCVLGACDQPLRDLEVIESVDDGSRAGAVVFRSPEEC